MQRSRPKPSTSDGGPSPLHYLMVARPTPCGLAAAPAAFAAEAIDI
jgi:hypothetical protein